jgi:hypothetical protein
MNDQAWPFHLSANGSSVSSALKPPTAMQNEPERHDTPANELVLSRRLSFCGGAVAARARCDSDAAADAGRPLLDTEAVAPGLAETGPVKTTRVATIAITKRTRLMVFPSPWKA